jgi:hypothetical protein
MNYIVNYNTFKINTKYQIYIMSIQDRDKTADRESAKTSIGQNPYSFTEEVRLQTNSETQESIEPERTAEATIEDKSKDFKDHPMPSFQEMDTPDTTLATTSTKVEELKARSVAIAEQTIVRSEENTEATESD